MTWAGRSSSSPAAPAESAAPPPANSSDVAPRWPSSTSTPTTPQIAARMSSHSAIGVVADVRVRDTLDLAVAEIVDRFGRIDVAIANAGILSRAATLRTTPASSIESVLAVNVTGVVNTVAGRNGSSHCSPRAVRPHQFGVRVPQRHGHHPLCHEQGRRRATRPRAARGTRRTWGLDDGRLLLPHRHRHDQTRRRRRSRRRRTPRSPAAAPAQTPPTRRCGNSTRRRPHPPFAARHGAGQMAAHLCAARNRRPRTGSTSGTQPTNPSRTRRTRRTNATPQP